VRGVKELRVGGHAIAPLMANSHTKSLCYLIIGGTPPQRRLVEDVICNLEITPTSFSGKISLQKRSLSFILQVA